ncbi:MAG: hypothetical protein KGK00_18475 [Paracoccaceae bacterium]|nr:hypothetical protein [Paracoccaceae bacterium]
MPRLAILVLAMACVAGCVHMPDVGPKTVATGPWPRLAPLPDFAAASAAGTDSATMASSAATLNARAAALEARAAELRATGGIDPAELDKLTTPIPPVTNP